MSDRVLFELSHDFSTYHDLFMCTRVSSVCCVITINVAIINLKNYMDVKFHGLAQLSKTSVLNINVYRISIAISKHSSTETLTLQHNNYQY